MYFRLPLFLFLAFLAAPAGAILCSTDAVPAATLLLPYFEIDLDPPGGVPFLHAFVDVHNASPKAALANVVIWSDLSVPVLQFHLYLEGYGRERFSLRDLLFGRLPRSGPGVSPQGPFSVENPDLDLIPCSEVLPYPSQLPSSLVEGLQAALLGLPSPLFGEECVGRLAEDTVARGYLTVDVVRTCSLLSHDDPGYFADNLARVAAEDNVLWGSYESVDSWNLSGEGGTLVHIEAQPGAFEVGSATFYGRYVGWSGADHREPLPTRFHVPYHANPALAESVELIVWRDPLVPQEPFSCEGAPGWFPLTLNELAAFDQDLHPSFLDRWGSSPAPPAVEAYFPAAAQKINLDSDLPLLFNAGWLHLDSDTDFPPWAEDRPSQAWVTVIRKGGGLFSAGFPAIQAGPPCSPPTPPTSVLGQREGSAVPGFNEVPPIVPPPFCGPGGANFYLQSYWAGDHLIDLFDCIGPAPTEIPSIACSFSPGPLTPNCQDLGVPLP